MLRAAMVLAGPVPNHSWVTIAGDGSVAAIALAWWVLVLYAAVARRRGASR